MNEEQQEAFDIVTKQRSNIFLTGPAGTGKSFTIKEIVNWAKLTQKRLGVTSSTGTSAITINGRTLHSFLGIGLAKKDAYQLYMTAKRNSNLIEKLKLLDILIVDEISMISDKLFDKVSEYLGLIRKNKSPFGGIQLILCGDMCQLPPVDGEYCFKAKTWSLLSLNIIELKTLVRQDGDKEFQLILNEARFGTISDSNIKRLKSLQNPNFGEVQPTVLYSKNINVDSVNDGEYTNLIKNGAIERVYYTQFSNNKHSQNWAESLKLPVEVRLCIGAQVMLTVNLCVDEGLANGSRGVVTEFTENGPVVLFKTGDQVVIEPWIFVDDNEDESSSDGEDEKITVKCIPLRLAYALTIHKSQSATLDSAVVSLGASIFEYGQAYTALSRVRDMQSIKVIDVLKSSFQTHPDVVEFYKKTI